MHLLVALDGPVHDAPPVPLRHMLQIAAATHACHVFRQHNRSCSQTTWQYPQMRSKNVRICVYISSSRFNLFSLRRSCAPPALKTISASSRMSNTLEIMRFLRQLADGGPRPAILPLQSADRHPRRRERWEWASSSSTSSSDESVEEEQQSKHVCCCCPGVACANRGGRSSRRHDADKRYDAMVVGAASVVRPFGKRRSRERRRSDGREQGPADEQPAFAASAASAPVSAAAPPANDDSPAPAAPPAPVAAPKLPLRGASTTPGAASAALPGEPLLSNNGPAPVAPPPAASNFPSSPKQPKKRKPTEFGLLFGSFMKKGLGNVRAMAAAKEAWAARKNQQ